SAISPAPTSRSASRATTTDRRRDPPSRRRRGAGRQPCPRRSRRAFPLLPIRVMKTILTDIEGTTSSISFVKDVLFPYARQALPGFIAHHGKDPEVRRWLDVVALDQGGVCQDRMLVEILQGWIDEDRKHTALKALQGMIWKSGYESGAYRAHLYPDV